jgi:hypothetical protein
LAEGTTPTTFAPDVLNEAFLGARATAALTGASASSIFVVSTTGSTLSLTAWNEIHERILAAEIVQWSWPWRIVMV